MNNRSYLSGILILLLLGLFNVACTGRAATSTATDWRSFDSPLIGNFSIEYPRAWQSGRFPAGNRSDDEVIALFYAAGAPFPVVRVARREFPAPTLAEVAAWGEEGILALNPDSDDQFELFPLVEETIPAGEVLSREYVMDLETALPLMKKDVYIAREGDGIILTFTTVRDRYEAEKAIFEHMVASFRSLDGGSTE